MAGIAQSEHFVETMARLLAARILRLAEEENTILTSSHLRYGGVDFLQVPRYSDHYKLADNKNGFRGALRL